MADSRWQQFVGWSSRERFLMGASIFRLISGSAILIEYLLNYAQRHYLFGPDGLFPYQAFETHMTYTSAFSVYAWSRSPVYFEVCYHLGILVAVLWWLGWHTRVMTALCFVFWFSLHQRFPSLWDGGDNLMRLVMMYGMVANLGAYFSLDAQRRAGQPAPPAWRRQVSAILHSGAMLAFALQISLVYGVAGLYKVQGEAWREGTALYYAFRGGQFVWAGVSDIFYQNDFLMVALAYLTVAYQVSFPFLLFMNRYTRLVALVLGVSFHLGIALFMGLITFSLFMMAVDLSLIDDDEYRALGRWAERLWNRRRQQPRPAEPEQPAAATPLAELAPSPRQPDQA